jgi:hypothetical protein
VAHHSTGFGRDSKNGCLERKPDPPRYHRIMRYTPPALVIVLFLCASAFSQSLESDDPLMAKARAAYDAPFTRNLASFDCSVQFDWKQHYAEMFGTFPASAAPTVEKLQAVNHRVNVDHTQAVVSSLPKQPDFSAAEHRPQLEQLEQVFIAMVSSGLNAWIPSSTNVVLPVGKTQYKFEKLPSGYKVTMKGENVAGTLLLEPDLRVTSGVMQLPQPIRFQPTLTQVHKGLFLLLSKRGRPQTRSQAATRLSLIPTNPWVESKFLTLLLSLQQRPGNGVTASQIAR